MKVILIAAAVACGPFVAQSANAQAISLYGVRAEADAGLDRFYSEGNHRNRFGYGAEVGIDGLIGGGVVVGAYGSLWNADTQNITRDGPGLATRRSREEWAAGLRAGTLLSPSTLLYVKGGWAVNKQSKRFVADNSTGSYYNRYNTEGWQAGVGVEQQFGRTLYWKAEGRYTNYRTNSSRLAALVGVGIRFGQSTVGAVPVAPIAPPPPPAPVPPATQTCQDGAVILANDACPVAPPPPPPPPPPAKGERG